MPRITVAISGCCGVGGPLLAVGRLSSPHFECLLTGKQFLKSSVSTAENDPRQILTIEQSNRNIVAPAYL
jgi:hypothetical protein